jgi:hypothetical protein
MFLCENEMVDCPSLHPISDGIMNLQREPIRDIGQFNERPVLIALISVTTKSNTVTWRWNFQYPHAASESMQCASYICKIPVRTCAPSINFNYISVSARLEH